MKMIGFLKEHDSSIESATLLSDNLTHDNIDEHILQKIISYLDNGNSFSGVPVFLRDNEGKDIGGLEYLTDGEYIWPSYITHYLKKYPNFKINTEFINHIKKTDFEVKHLSHEDLIEVSDFFMVEWRGEKKISDHRNHPKGIKKVWKKESDDNLPN